MRIKQYQILTILFLGVLIPHLMSKTITSFDSRWTVPTALSIIREGNTDLDEFKDLLEKHRYYAIERIYGHSYSQYPVGVSVLAVPFVFLVDKILSGFPELGGSIRRVIKVYYGYDLKKVDVLTLSPGIELFIASLFVALTACLIYLIGRQWLDWKGSLFLCFIFAFCTSAWSTASRGLWQHGPSMFFLSMALYSLLKAEKKPWWGLLTGLSLALSYGIRPTNSISVALFTLLIFFRYRFLFLRFLIGALAIAVPFLAYNFFVYHAFLSPYYLLLPRIGFHLRIGSLIGTLVSPSRGLFIYSPVFVFSLWGMVLKIRSKEARPIDYSLMGILLLHWLTIASFPDWGGGHSFGPRYFTDMVPYLIFFLIPMLSFLRRPEGLVKKVGFFLLCLCIVASVFVHYRCANSRAVFNWDEYPVDVTFHLERYWDWGDIQFLRGIQ